VADQWEYYDPPAEAPTSSTSTVTHLMMAATVTVDGLPLITTPFGVTGT
jgi:hypothetical protein